MTAPARRWTLASLTDLGQRLLETAGCSADDAALVAKHLVDAESAGHRSHGVARLVEYIPELLSGRWSATARPEVVRERPSVAVVDGNSALGPVGATLAADLAADGAEKSGVRVVTLRNTAHIGRCGAYAERIASRGMIGLAFVNAGSLGYQVSPFGGLDGRISTNPIVFAAPRRTGPAILVDCSTSTVAEGRLRLALAEGQQVPDGCILDPEGQPTTDPAEFLVARPRGSILPLGGALGYKGFALGIMVEVLGGALAGAGCAAGDTEFRSNGVVLAAVAIEQFIGLDTYFDEVEKLIAHVKSSRAVPGGDGILLPGEREALARDAAQRDGLQIDPNVWIQIQAAGQQVGVRLP